MKKAIVISLSVLLAVLLGGFASAGDEIMFSPGEIMWNAGPATLPPGSEIAVLEGNPNSAGLVTMRIKLPPDSMLAPHTHESAERDTVISGKIYIGTGEKIDKTKAKAFPAGSYFVIPKGETMYGFTGKEGAVVQLTVEGPWTISYIKHEEEPMK
jgi:quercetin dioxygenase-like cupin family protein